MGKAVQPAKRLAEKDFYDRLQDLCRSRGIHDNAALAKAMGVSVKLTWKWWKKISKPSVVGFGWLIQVLDLTMEELEDWVGVAPGVKALRLAGMVKLERRQHALGSGVPTEFQAEPGMPARPPHRDENGRDNPDA